MSVINKKNLFCDTDTEEAKIYSNQVLEELSLPKITKKEWGKMEVISICN